MRLENPEQLAKVRDEFRKKLEGFQATISVCGGTGCQASGCQALVAAVERELKDRNLGEKVRLLVTGCHGFCQQGPIMVVQPGDVFYPKVKPEWVPEIIEKTVLGGIPIEKYLYRNPKDRKRIVKENEIPFYSSQIRPLLGGNRYIDPLEIGDYIASGGYSALVKALFEMAPDEIVYEVKKSGLRGRGGGGFPAGRKWETARKAEGEHKWVICNADEGDPGAFMDEAVLEGNPHLVVEGMIIGAKAVGAGGGYVYVRNEYPLALKKITRAIEQARKWGLLGKNTYWEADSILIFGSIAAAERSCAANRPRSWRRWKAVPESLCAKYIHTVEHGYHNEPTVLNNVETWANVPRIILDGAEKFRELGTEGSTGTKIFSLVGKVNNTGLVEIPMGMSLRLLVEEIGGGIPKRKHLKAVQTGGPSGGCLPERFSGPACGFRCAYRGGEHDGVGRDNRDGRRHMHGGCRVIFHSIFAIGIVRKMHAVPRGTGGDGPRAHVDYRGPRNETGFGLSRRACGMDAGREPVRARVVSRQSGKQHASIFPRRIYDSYRGGKMSRRGMSGAS